MSGDSSDGAPPPLPGQRRGRPNRPDERARPDHGRARGDATGQPPDTERFVTGGFTPVERFTQEHSIEELRRGAAQQPTTSPDRPSGPIEMLSSKGLAEISRDIRFRYGIWGAAVGAITGIAIGALNAFFEGVIPSPNQPPMIILTLMGIFLGGGVSAWRPRTIERLLRENNLLRD